jgi:hypothetical protein
MVINHHGHIVPAEFKVHSPKPFAHSLGANVLRVVELGQDIRLNANKLIMQ